jgi:hypothetical protein
MAEPYPKLLVEVRPSHELYVDVFGTPESLRIFARTLQSSVESLPSSVSDRQRVTDFYVGDAGGSKQEVYLSFFAEPSLDYLPARQRRRTFREYIGFFVLIVAVVFAVIGFMTVSHWSFGR